ncbi:MAG TPA: two-component regulator propeller domain-containing protein, partial [Flavobacteriales bacterium]|nr:two-component regulator propeller domain-containing protein [Flavobacteriales bacterium]
HNVGRRLLKEPLPKESDGARIMALAMGRNGALYVGTDGGGLFVRDHLGIRSLEGFPSDTATNVRALLALSDGRLLIGLRNGMLSWKNGRCTPLPLGDAEPKAISAITISRDGSLWVGTFGHGLYRIRPDGKQTAYDEENGLLQSNVRCLLVDDRDRLWVGSKFGLNLLEGERMRVFTVHQGMPNDNVQCAFQDREGNLWFGTDGAGVLQYAGDRFVTFTVKDGLCSDLVMSVTADDQGGLWLGTYDNGICRMDGMAMISTLDGLPNNTVWCGLSDHAGSLWFGTSDGLAHVEQGLVKPIAPGASLSGQRVFALHEDREGQLWCGTRDGLTLIDTEGKVTTYPSDAKGSGRSVRSIVPDERGRLWLATDQGIRVFDGTGFSGYDTTQGLCDNTVLCLLRDPEGHYWAGTSNGLSCFDGDRFRTFRFASDFGSNYIDLLQLDELGRIWAGTNNGLFLFHPDSLLKDSLANEHITLNEGLRSLEFNLNAGFLDDRGRLLIGSNGGLVFHDVEKHLSKTAIRPPQVHITSVRSFLQRTDWKGQCDSLDGDGLPIGLHLAYRRNHLTFDYTGISLTAPDRVLYRYRLVGFDQDWLPITKARFASYSNLPHGPYTFEVMARVDGGTWSAPGIFRFRIEPPFWSRWWFFVLCALVLGGSAYGTVRYRAMRRERRERTRQLMLRSRMLQLEQQALNANMNRHFVFNALNSIQYHINKQDRATASRYLTSFAKLIRKNLDASQNDTTTLAEELERLELYLQLEHMRFKDKFQYTIDLKAGVDTAHVRLPAMMLQPYVENSIWHGILPMEQQGQVTIVVEPASSGRVRVRIEDDGIGFDISRLSKGDAPNDHISRGIEITKGRADVLRKLELTDIRIDGPHQWHDPATGAILGTRVAIELPMNGLRKKPEDSLHSTLGPITFEGP